MSIPKVDLQRALKQIRAYLLLLIGVFLSAMAIGYSTADPFTDYIRKYLKEHSATLSSNEKQILQAITTPSGDLKRSSLSNPNLVKRTIWIFLHNTKAVALTLYGGILLFFIPIFQKALLGYIAGVTLRIDSGYGFMQRIIPHVFIEFPVTFIVSAFAVLLGVNFVRAPSVQRKAEFIANLRFATRVYLLSIPFSFMAAVLECYGKRLMWGQ